MSKISISFEKSLNAWERELVKAHETGRGKYKDLMIREIHDFFKVINLIDNEEFEAALELIYYMDSSEKDMIPMRVWNYLNKV